MDDPKKLNKILVIDHNIYRFHHYNLMESMLFYKPFFNKLKPEYSGYLTMTIDQQLDFLAHGNSEINILKFFSDDTNMDEYMSILTNHIDFSKKDPLYCDMYFGLPTISAMELIELHIVKLSSDCEYPDKLDASTKIINHSNLFDVQFFMDYINENQISVVICDSMDMAIKLSEGTESISFVVPNYRYNYELIGSQLLMKYMKETIDFQLMRKHNYTMFENMKGGE